MKYSLSVFYTNNTKTSSNLFAPNKTEQQIKYALDEVPKELATLIEGVIINKVTKESETSVVIEFISGIQKRELDEILARVLQAWNVEGRLFESE